MNLPRGENCGLSDASNTKQRLLKKVTQNLVNLHSGKRFSASQQKETTDPVALVNSISSTDTSNSFALKLFSLDPDLNPLKTENMTLETASDSQHQVTTSLSQTTNDVNSMLVKINEGLAKHVLPLKNGLGTSGIYSFRDARRNPIAMFKLIDEEPTVKPAKVPLMQKRFVPRSRSFDSRMVKFSFESRPTFPEKRSPAPRSGLFSGELCLREAAAYLLDEKGLHSVPPTLMVKVQRHVFGVQHSSTEMPKLGSLQKFVTNNGVVSNINFAKFPVREVQKIALLDLRMLNSDRNEANILFRRNDQQEISLIPIDHALSLPDKLEVYQADLCWLNWPQCREPLDSELAKFVNEIDPMSDYQKLKCQLGIRSECLFNLVLAEVFLKKAIQKGFSLYKIAKLVYRINELSKSPLEKLVDKTQFLYDLIVKKSDGNKTSLALFENLLSRENKKTLFTPQKDSSRLTPMPNLSKFNPSGFCKPVETVFNVNALPIFGQNLNSTFQFPTSLSLSRGMLFSLSESTPETLNPTPIDLSWSLPSPTRLKAFPDFTDKTNAVLDNFGVGFGMLDRNVFSDPNNHTLLNLNQFSSMFRDVDLSSMGLQTKKIRKNTFQVENNGKRVGQRSSTQHKQELRSLPLKLKSREFETLKRDEKRLTEFFFELFGFQVDKFLENLASKIPRKYTAEYSVKELFN